MNQQVDNELGGYDESAAVAHERGQLASAVGGGKVTNASGDSKVCAPAPTYTAEADIEAMAEDAFIEWNPYPPMHSIMRNTVRINQKKPFIAGYIAGASPVHAELARLRTRLEMDFVYNHRGEPEPWEDGMPDGIDCRNQTIQILEQNNESLRLELARAKIDLCEKDDEIASLRMQMARVKADNEMLREAVVYCHNALIGLGAQTEITHQYPERANDIDWMLRHVEQALQQKGGE